MISLTGSCYGGLLIYICVFQEAKKCPLYVEKGTIDITSQSFKHTREVSDGQGSNAQSLD